MISQGIERARLLLEQNRYQEAMKELEKSLASDPNNPEILSLLSICKSADQKYKEAEQLIKSAISLDPANPFLIYILAKVYFDQEKYKEAESHIREAIQIDPYNADFFGLLSAIYLNQKEWTKGLEMADKGLEISPDNLTCLNLRSTALIKLDKKEESYDTIHQALNYDPENSMTHTNLGWGLLEKGEHKKALHHFKKALQSDPGSEFAKHGLIEALKARYWVYRMFLKYAFWIGNMKGGAQWAVIIGFYIGNRVVRSVAESNPSLKPFLMPLIFLYILFAISTWIIGPISNLFLRLNVYGRYALSNREIQASNFVGASLAIGLLSFMAYFILQSDLFMLTGIFGVSMMIPLASMFVPDNKNKRMILIAYAGGLGLVGVTGISLLVIGNPAAEIFGMIYIIGIIAYQWIANAILTR
ncbi:MAG: tetratricopeptide repeat protein [Cytophagaceae bacterium]